MYVYNNIFLSCLLSVHLSLPLSSSLPASLSDESLMTPDAENAVVSPILPFLFLGNERDAQDLDLLLRLNIGYVVNVTTHLPLYHVNSGLRYKRLPATDNSKQNLRQYFEEVFEFIGKGSTSDRLLSGPRQSVGLGHLLFLLLYSLRDVLW